MRSTIRDVSRVAGVSIKTVSRVLNDERYVGAATRARVEAAVAALGFRPNAAARSLAGRRSFQVALICDNPSPYYVYEMQAGVRARCEAAGVRMLAQPYDRHADTLVDLVQALIDTTNLDGVIPDADGERRCRGARSAGAPRGTGGAGCAGGTGGHDAGEFHRQ